MQLAKQTLLSLRAGVTTRSPGFLKVLLEGESTREIYSLFVKKKTHVKKGRCKMKVDTYIGSQVAFDICSQKQAASSLPLSQFKDNLKDNDCNLDTTVTFYYLC
jgi:hypothetical protein